jgi:hypothetical protein
VEEERMGDGDAPEKSVTPIFEFASTVYHECPDQRDLATKASLPAHLG